MDREEQALKSTYKRIRKAPKRRGRCIPQSTVVHAKKERLIHKKKSCEIVSEAFPIKAIKYLLENETDSIKNFGSIKVEMHKRLMETLLDGKHESLRKNVSEIDIYHLNLAHNHLHNRRETILKLPKLTDKLYAISSLDVMPYNYRRDHLWLTLQWEIDEVENPFLARPCQSTECLGSFIQNAEEEESESMILENGRLPELTPLTVLDEYRDHRRQGMSTGDFKKLIGKQNSLVGSNAWGQPKCAICRMQELFEKAMDPTRKKCFISLNEYHTFFGLQFTGLRQEFVINSKVANFSFCISETGVDAPSIDIPVVGLVVNGLRRRGKEIIVDKLYTE